jgi:hypothetical protein
MARKKFDSNIELRNVEGADVPDFGATAIFAKDDRLWSMDSSGDQCMVGSGAFSITPGDGIDVTVLDVDSPIVAIDDGTLEKINGAISSITAGEGIDVDADIPTAPTLSIDAETLAAIEDKLDAMVSYSASDRTSAFFHSAGGGGYTFRDGGDDSSCFLGVAVESSSALKNEISALDGARMLAPDCSRHWRRGTTQWGRISQHITAEMSSQR